MSVDPDPLPIGCANHKDPLLISEDLGHTFQI
jgi:hypothetical protein